MRSNPTLKKWYKIFNKKWFDNSLPQNTKVIWDTNFSGANDDSKRMTYGEADGTSKVPVIRINPVLMTAVDGGLKTIAAETLLHEMAHLEEFKTGVGDHGKSWEKVMLRLAKKGAFSKKNGVVPNSLW